jgi:hypothetical protein
MTKSTRQKISMKIENVNNISNPLDLRDSHKTFHTTEYIFLKPILEQSQRQSIKIILSKSEGWVTYKVCFQTTVTEHSIGQVPVAHACNPSYLGS